MPFLFGAVGFTPQREPLNSAVMLDSSGKIVDRYDKINLVPFGEFIPPMFGWVNRITKEIGDFVPGERVVVFPLDGHNLGAFICYESVFPDLVRQFVHAGAEVLVNLSNDGYFGHSAAHQQHLEIVRMRAAENRRWILRATNDGITAAIDPAGALSSECLLLCKPLDCCLSITKAPRRPTRGTGIGSLGRASGSDSLMSAGSPARRRP